MTIQRVCLESLASRLIDVVNNYYLTVRKIGHSCIKILVIRMNSNMINHCSTWSITRNRWRKNCHECSSSWRPSIPSSLTRYQISITSSSKFNRRCCVILCSLLAILVDVVNRLMNSCFVASCLMLMLQVNIVSLNLR